jgi:hypothetical protein
MRLRAVLAVSLVATGLIALPALASGCSTARAQSGRNPTYAQVSAAMDSAANRRRVPPALMRAIGWKESGWGQFWSDGRAKVSGDCGIGIMQITGGSWDYARLARDYVYNIDAGAQVLASKMAASSANVPSALRPDDTRVFENWYRATYRYNGSGSSAERYADSVFSLVTSPPSSIAPWSPAVRVSNPKSVVSGYHPTSGTAYVAHLDGTWKASYGTYRGPVQRADYLAATARMWQGVALEGDQRKLVSFAVRNIGYATWTPATVPLQTYPRGRGSLLRDATWPDATTPVKLKANVVTGGTAVYSFAAKAARVSASRTVDEAFAPSIAGVPIATSSATSRWTLHPVKAPVAAIRTAPAYVTDQSTVSAATFTVSGSDPTPGSGLLRIELSKRRICADCTWSTPVAVSTTTRVALSGEGAHQVRVRSIDKAGHVGAWTAPRLVIVPRDNGSARVAYEGAWQSASTSGTFLGSLHTTTDVDAALETSATADRLAIIGTRAPDAARFSVFVDGLLVATVDPVADSVQQRVVLWSQRVARGAHTVRVEVEGDPGLPGMRADAGPAPVARIDAIALAVTS